MKFYVETITVLKDGTSPISIFEKASKNEAISAFHSELASASINTNVLTCHCEVKDNEGGIHKSDTFKAEVVEE